MKKQKILITIMGMMSLFLVTAGITVAFFNYTKQGTTENTITTGTIEFIYIEKDKVGAGIQIENAYPMSDDVGKEQSDSNQVFNFKIESETMSDVSIPYEVTARVKEGSTLPSDVVKLYLTEVEGANETELLLDNYSNLPQTSQALAGSNIEKVIYTDTVPADSTYEKNFKLRMWIDEGTNFSPVKDENGNDTYPYNDKTFAVTVNVYSNGKVQKVYSNYENGSEIYFNVSEGEKCTLTEVNNELNAKSGCLRFYAINDEETSETVTLLLDHNTTSIIYWNPIELDINMNYITDGRNVNGPSEAFLNQLNEDTKDWTGVEPITEKYTVSNGTANYTIDYTGFKARIISADEIAQIINMPYDRATTTSTKYLGSSYPWLIENIKDCTYDGCQNEDTSTFGYWTSTAVPGDEKKVWAVYDPMFSNNNAGTNNYGIRPVITVSKELIK